METFKNVIQVKDRCHVGATQPSFLDVKFIFIFSRRKMQFRSIREDPEKWLPQDRLSPMLENEASKKTPPRAAGSRGSQQLSLFFLLLFPRVLALSTTQSPSDTSLCRQPRAASPQLRNPPCSGRKRVFLQCS